MARKIQSEGSVFLRSSTLHCEDDEKEERTNENLDLVPLFRTSSKLFQTLLDNLLVDVPFLSLPSLRRFIKSEDNVELIRFATLNIFEFFTEENVFFGLVREDQGDFRLVRRVGIDRLEDLPHGSDTGSTSDQSD